MNIPRDKRTQRDKDKVCVRVRSFVGWRTRNARDRDSVPAIASVDSLSWLYFTSPSRWNFLLHNHRRCSRAIGLISAISQATRFKEIGKRDYLAVRCNEIGSPREALAERRARSHAKCRSRYSWITRTAIIRDSLD